MGFMGQKTQPQCQSTEGGEVLRTRLQSHCADNKTTYMQYEKKHEIHTDKHNWLYPESSCKNSIQLKIVGVCAEQHNRDEAIFVFVWDLGISTQYYFLLVDVLQQ